MPSRVVIIGGGFGGLNAAKKLCQGDYELLILDKHNHHLFQPLLYQVAGAALSPANIAVPIREMFRKKDNVSVYMANIVRVDKERKQVIAANGEVFPYDFLILAVGASHSYFGHPEWEAFAPGLKTLEDALRIREKILLTFEEAERSTHLVQEMCYLRFIIIGAGPTGVEMAGAIAEIARESLFRNFRQIEPEHSEIILIEGTGQVLPTFPKELGDRAQQDLEKMGVQVRLNQMVTQVVENGVYIGEEFLHAHNIIWAAGNRASDLLRTLDTPLDRVGRVMVQPDLTIPGHPEIFVIGDAANVKNGEGQVLPGIAPVAIQQGIYVASLLKKNRPPEQRRPFHYADKGLLATIGKAKAVGKIGSWKVKGYLAWLLWGVVHIFYLISFRNRMLVMFQWMFLYLSNRRQVRIIRQPIHEEPDSR